MKILQLLTFLTVTAVPMLNAQESFTLTVERIPATVEEFVTLRDTVGQTPEGGALLTIIAMLKYTEDPAEGTRFFTAMLVNDGSQLRKTSRGGYQGMEPSATNLFLIGKLADAPWIARSYLAGTGPDNTYALPPAPWTVTVLRRKDSEQGDGSVKLYLISTGADSPRPLRLKKNDRGIWKIAEFSTLFVGVRSPKKPSDDL